MLGVHVQGDKTFSMHKQWGHGDETLTPIYSEYENTIIRWGNKEVTKAVLEYSNNRSKAHTTKEEFLY